MRSIVFAVLDATGEEDEPEAIGVRNGRLFDLALNAQRNELLAEECLPGDSIRLGASQVSHGAENHRIAGRLSEMQKSMFKEGNEMAEQWGQPVNEGEHVNQLPENYQKLSADCICCSDEVKPKTD